MDIEEIRSQIITILKDQNRITYDDLFSRIGGNCEEIRSVCNILRLEELIKDVDNIGIKSTGNLKKLLNKTNICLNPFEEYKDIKYSFLSHLENKIPHLDSKKKDNTDKTYNQTNSKKIHKTTQPVPPKSSKKIFLSYGHDKYTDIALRIQEDLHIRGYNVWFDKDKLKEGRDWELYIEHGLKDCDCFILLLTPHSVRRRNPFDQTSSDGFCLNEIAKALENQKLIIPIMLVEVEDGLPTSICRIQYLDIRDSIPIEENEEKYFVYLNRLVDAIEYHDLDFEGGQQRLIKLLDPLNFQSDIAEHVSRFTGRKWLLDEISTWLLTKSSSRIFWLTGDPGVGKSAISAYFCHKRGEVIGHHFCSHNNSEERDPRKMLLSLAYQLTQWSSIYNQRVNTINLEKKILENTPALFKILFIKIFEGFPPPKNDKIIVIDAIDEATVGIKNEIAEFIRDYWSKTPSWLKLVITSRREASVIFTLSHLEPVFFDTTNSENIEDIRNYLINQLSIRKIDYNPYVIEKILNKSEGIFLYVIEFLNSLDSKNLFLDQPETFPNGLIGIYNRLFNRQFKDLTQYEELIKPILECIAAQRSSIPLTIIADSADIDINTLRDRLFFMGSLFPVKIRSDSIPVISPFHKSIIDWLEGVDSVTQLHFAGNFRIDKKTGRAALTQACLKSWYAGSRDQYLIKHLPVHLFEENLMRELSLILIDPVFIQEKIKTEGIYALLCDFDYIENSQMVDSNKVNTILCIKNALRLSSYTLIRDTNQFAPQMIGRLSEFEDIEIREFLKKIRPIQKGIWLRPLTKMFTAPGESFLGYLEGHSNINSIDIRFDGNIVVSGSDDKIIRIHDIKTGNILDEYNGHTRPITSVKFSYNGNKIFSASFDNSIRIWDSNSGNCLKVLTGHTNGIWSISVNSQKGLIISGSNDKSLRIWDIETGKCLNILKGHSHAIFSVAFSCDGKVAVSGSYDKTLRIWDIENGKCLFVLHGHTGAIKSVAISLDGTIAISGSYDNTIRIWNLESGKCLHELRGHTSVVNSLSISSDGTIAISGSSDNSIRIWDIESGICLRSLEDLKREIYSISVCFEKNIIVSGSGDNLIHVWDLAHISRYEGHNISINSVSASPNGKMIASGSNEGIIRIWNKQSGHILYDLGGHYNIITSVAFDNNNKIIISGSYDKTIRIWDLDKRKCLHHLSGHDHTVSSVAINSEQNIAISGSWDNTIRIWDLKDDSTKYILEGHLDWITSLALSTDANTVISGSNDQTVRVWDSQTGFCQQILTGHTEAVCSVGISANGLIAISGSADKTIIVWDLKNNDNYTLKGHTGSVFSVALSSDGLMAVSGSWDKTVRVWDIKNRKCLHIFENRDYPVTSVSIDSDAHTAVSGSIDKTISVWDLNHGNNERIIGRYLNSISDFKEMLFAKVILSYDCKYALSVSWDNIVWVWDIRTGNPFHIIGGHNNLVSSIYLNSNSKYAVIGTFDNKISVWNLISMKCIQILYGHTNPVITLSLDLDGSILISGSDDNTIRVWDVQSGNCLNVLNGHKKSVRTVVLSRDRSKIISGSDDNTIRVWDVQSGECLKVLNGHTKPVCTVALNSDCSIVVSGSDDCTIRVWDVQSGECLNVLKGHTKSVSTVALSSDCSIIVSGSDDNTIRRWNFHNFIHPDILNRSLYKITSITLDANDMEVFVGTNHHTVRRLNINTGDCLSERRGKIDFHETFSECTVFNPDGETLLSTSEETENRIIYVKKIKTGELLKELKGHTKTVTAISVSPDGKNALSGSDDCTIRVWDIETAICLHTLRGHTGTVNSVLICFDGKIAISCSSDQTIRVWDIHSGLCHYTIYCEQEINSLASSQYQLIAKGRDGKDMFFSYENINFGIPICTPKILEGLLKVSCPHCYQFFGIDKEDIGQKIICSNCDGYIQLNPFVPGIQIINPYLINETLKVSCPFCNQSYEIDKQYIGHLINCSFCGKFIQVNSFVRGENNIKI